MHSCEWNKQCMASFPEGKYHLKVSQRDRVSLTLRKQKNVPEKNARYGRATPLHSNKADG